MFEIVKGCRGRKSMCGSDVKRERFIGEEQGGGECGLVACGVWWLKTRNVEREIGKGYIGRQFMWVNLADCCF